MSKLYQEDRNKVALLKFIILMTIIAIVAMLATSCEKSEVVEPTSCNFRIYELQRGYGSELLCKYVWLDSILVGTISETEALNFYDVKCGESKIIDHQVTFQNGCGAIIKATKKIYSK